MNHYILNPNPPADFLQALEKDTPLVEYKYSFKDELTQEEIREHENQIARLTIDLMKRSEMVRELQAEMKADNETRHILATTLDSGKTMRIAEMALKFYDPRERTITVFAKADDGYKFVLTRESLAVEVEQWKARQAEIAQQEIEAGAYRQTLYSIAGETTEG